MLCRPATQLARTFADTQLEPLPPDGFVVPPPTSTPGSTLGRAASNRPRAATRHSRDESAGRPRPLRHQSVRRRGLAGKPANRATSPRSTWDRSFPTRARPQIEARRRPLSTNSRRAGSECSFSTIPGAWREPIARRPAPTTRPEQGLDFTPVSVTGTSVCLVDAAQPGQVPLPHGGRRPVTRQLVPSRHACRTRRQAEAEAGRGGRVTRCQRGCPGDVIRDMRARFDEVRPSPTSARSPAPERPSRLGGH